MARSYGDGRSSMPSSRPRTGRSTNGVRFVERILDLEHTNLVDKVRSLLARGHAIEVLLVRQRKGRPRRRVVRLGRPVGAVLRRANRRDRVLVSHLHVKREAAIGADRAIAPAAARRGWARAEQSWSASVPVSGPRVTADESRPSPLVPRTRANSGRVHEAMSRSILTTRERVSPEASGASREV